MAPKNTALMPLDPLTLLRQMASDLDRTFEGSPKIEDVKAAFSDGVLEVSVPLSAKAQAKPRTVEIQDAPKVAKSAA